MSSDNVSILLNNGNGIFALDSTYSVGDCPVSVFASDLNGDGNLDLAVANECSGNVSVLLSKGRSTFLDHSIFEIATDASPKSVYAADLDGDGDFDLETANYLSEDISIL